MRPLPATACALFLVLSGCGGSSGSSGDLTGFGSDPKLPAPDPGIVVNVPKAVGWTGNAKPVAPKGFSVTRYAGGLDHPRWLLVLPNGDVLAAESASEPHKATGLMDWAGQTLQKRGGALKVSPDRIVLLRDVDGDGVAEARAVFAQGLQRPQGMALVGETLFVANDNALVAFDYRGGQTKADGAPRKIADLPGGPINHHWTKTVVASPDGTKLYVAIGSNSNIGENGMAAETGRARIVEMNLDGSGERPFATGLRNPNGMDWNPATGALWTAVNERDMLGDDLVPDYMTQVTDGGFYGWPYSYFGGHVDVRVKPQQPAMVARALKPDYALGPHTASLGLAFYRAEAFPTKYRGGVFVGQHGSWNRKTPNGYRVVFIPFAGGRPSGQPEVFLGGFLNAKGQAQGRPVGVAVDKAGALLVADDAGDTVWRVSATKP